MMGLTERFNAGRDWIASQLNFETVRIITMCLLMFIISDIAYTWSYVMCIYYVHVSAVVLYLAGLSAGI